MSTDLSKKLRDVIPEEQKTEAKLTERALDLTGAKLQEMQNDHSLDGHLDAEDRKSILNLAVIRVNKGQTIFGFDKMEYKKDQSGSSSPTSDTW